MPGRWQKFVRRWLTHRVDVIRIAGNATFGAEPAPGTRLPQVPCFIDGSRSRTPTEGSLDQSVDFSVAFPHEVDIAINDTLQNGRDRDGRTILAEGRVVRLDPTVHPDFGELVRTALVVRA